LKTGFEEPLTFISVEPDINLISGSRRTKNYSEQSDGMTSNAWIGANCASSGRILLLMESTHGMLGADGVQMLESVYVREWCARHADPDYRDATFAALYKACATNGESRLEWWNRIAFFNLWPENLGPNNSTKATSAQLRAGAAMLPDRLRALAPPPRVVWVASTSTHQTLGVVEAIRAVGAHGVLSVHPVSRGNPIPKLAAAWAECGAITSARED
jgi:hypothetical protein